ncbi:unnamed protein product [Didymodactylos carnosus]|uniref:Mab-21-like HhH/H2TH-like domain-containing protein n=1 Tax=Didymodactylos carnosus TaxID=1234261 RepID=A0A815H6X2_9BILA|nr:unnamed protein product [Didymodactylos carnosus]CAF1347090.1 unnamed protein product [Didymodactylos carnosus]CAF3824160.1 unnamed protein product [Didymodactylos carnosus]CAF4213935.1 unnamed protein product [Didymodactylos carnosus]
MEQVVSMNNYIEISTGSQDEGQCYAKLLYSRDGALERDVMIVVANINKNESYLLEDIETVPGFLRIKWNTKLKSSGVPKGQRYNHLYVDGMGIKEVIYEKDQQYSLDENLVNVGRILVPKPCLEQASIPICFLDEFCLESFESNVRTMQLIIETNKNKLTCEVCEDLLASAHLSKTMYSSNMDEMFSCEIENKISPTICGANLCKPLYSICFAPAFGIPYSFEMKQKISCILKYYHLSKSILFSLNTYKHLSVLANEQRHPFQEHVLRDTVPAICLNFSYPPVLEWFLSRCQQHVRLNKLIDGSKCRVYLVAKWSQKTPDTDARFEFRYSFSLTEKFLTKQRRPKEKLVCSLARKFYYKILRDIHKTSTEYLKSYIIKTSILWLCELNDLEEQTTMTITEMISLWIEYMVNCFKDRYLPHYFINGMNLLQDYDDSLIEMIQHALQTANIEYLIKSFDYKTFESIGSVNYHRQLLHELKEFIESNPKVRDKMKQVFCASIAKRFYDDEVNTRPDLLETIFELWTC